jgi:hypothetical protein
MVLKTTPIVFKYNFQNTKKLQISKMVMYVKYTRFAEVEHFWSLQALN